jgi:hypothetical protein
MGKRTPPPELTAAEQFARFKIVVTHLLDGRPVVVRRRTYLKTMGCRGDLRCGGKEVAFT